MVHVCRNAQNLASAVLWSIASCHGKRGSKASTAAEGSSAYRCNPLAQSDASVVPGYPPAHTDCNRAQVSRTRCSTEPGFRRNRSVPHFYPMHHRDIGGSVGHQPLYECTPGPRVEAFAPCNAGSIANDRVRCNAPGVRSSPKGNERMLAGQTAFRHCILGSTSGRKKEALTWTIGLGSPSLEFCYSS